MTAAAFGYREGALHCEDVPLPAVAADHGTPAYVYSAASLREACRAFAKAFSRLDPLVNFAVKANSNIAVLSTLGEMGLGFDIVSLGELRKVALAGGDPGKVVFSGVGKGAEEIEEALAGGIRFLGVESAAELETALGIAAAHGTVAPLAVRLNPDIDADTHPHISTGLRENKFGVPFEDALGLARRIDGSPHGRLVAVSCHIGSQVHDVGALGDAAREVRRLLERLAADGIAPGIVDMGGGFGVDYGDPSGGIDLGACAGVFLDVFGVGEGSPRLMLEPGRILAARCGALLTRVRYVKRAGVRVFAIVDAAMNDLARPALYGARHRIVPVDEGRAPAAGAPAVDVVGPVCESADFLGKGLPLGVGQGDLLAVLDVGAYGMVMASNYNERPRACEVMVDGGRARVVRRRETYAEMFAAETEPQG